jgi:hypothetical protein
LEIELLDICAPRWQPEVDASREMQERYHYQGAGSQDGGENVWK